MELGLVAQKGNERATALADRVAEALEADGVTVRVDEATAAAVGRDGVPTGELASAPLVVSVGGDGTFLYAARHVGSTPILGVNLGEVGFLNAVPPEEAVEAVREEVALVVEEGAPRSRAVPRLAAEGGDWSLPPALNEVGLFAPQRGRGHGMALAVDVDGERFAAGHADGVLVATPTGSTAYNLAEGGPLVRPGVEALVVTLMSPREPTPPLVVDLESTVRLRAEGADHAEVASDGAARKRLETPAEVTVRRHPDPARIAGPSSTFFEALEKLEPAAEDG
ncbi:MAG: NAD(+)/NADH kinase [Halobacteriales archaeon]|nr:NAD(+)/NADH kinase [Halobacteriales archaeon]